MTCRESVDAGNNSIQVIPETLGHFQTNSVKVGCDWKWNKGLYVLAGLQYCSASHGKDEELSLGEEYIWLI